VVPKPGAGQTRLAYSADASEHEGVVYVVAVVEDIDADGLDDVVLLYGDPSVSMTEVALPFFRDDFDVEPTGAAIHADADRVFIAVSGIGLSLPDVDAVGWVTLGL
jgi:hypothetical protein